MAKFTPYGYTGIPSNPQDRDPDGVYYIRTATGFKLYTIANTPNREILELEVADTNTHVPYSGATNDVDLNTKKLAINGVFNKGLNTFDIKDLGGGTSASNHFKKYYDVASVIADGIQSGILKVEIPINTTTMWSMEVCLQEYASPTTYRVERTTNLIITAYNTTNVAIGVNCDNPWRIERVKFGRDAANTKTIVLIYPNNGSLFYGRAVISWVQVTRTYSSSLDLKNNYDISFVPTANIPSLDFVLSNEVLRSGFQRRDEHLEFGLGSKRIDDGWEADDLDALKVGNASPTRFISTLINNPNGNAPGFTYPFGIHFNASSAIRGDIILSHAHNRMAFRSNGRDFTEVWTGYNLVAGTLPDLNAGSSTTPAIWTAKTLSDWVLSITPGQYTLPTASASTKGGIKIGQYLTVSSEVLSVKVGATSDSVAAGNDSRINNGQTAFNWGNHAGLYKPLNWLPFWDDLQGVSPIGAGVLRMMDGDEAVDLFNANQSATSIFKKRKFQPQSDFWAVTSLDLSSSKKDQLVGFYNLTAQAVLVLPEDPENRQQIEVCNKSDTYFVKIVADPNKIDFVAGEYFLGVKSSIRLIFFAEIDSWVIVSLVSN